MEKLAWQLFKIHMRIIDNSKIIQKTSDEVKRQKAQEENCKLSPMYYKIFNGLSNYYHKSVCPIKK